MLNACKPHRLEYYFNNAKMRTWFRAGEAALLPVGTSSNEQRHFNFNSQWLRISRITLELLARLLLLCVIYNMGVSLRRATAPLTVALTWKERAHAWASQFMLFTPATWARFLETPRCTSAYATAPGAPRVAPQNRNFGVRPVTLDRDMIERDAEGNDLFVSIISTRRVRPVRRRGR